MYSRVPPNKQTTIWTRHTREHPERSRALGTTCTIRGRVGFSWTPKNRTAWSNTTLQPRPVLALAAHVTQGWHQLYESPHIMRTSSLENPMLYYYNIQILINRSKYKSNSVATGLAEKDKFRKWWSTKDCRPHLILEWLPNIFEYVKSHTRMIITIWGCMTSSQRCGRPHSLMIRQKEHGHNRRLKNNITRMNKQAAECPAPL